VEILVDKKKSDDNFKLFMSAVMDMDLVRHRFHEGKEGFQLTMWGIMVRDFLIEMSKEPD